MRIVVEPHKQEWEVQFAKAQEEFQEMPMSIPILAIEHVESTSIPGLVAKPVFDIDIVVTRGILATTRAAMASARYANIRERGDSFLQPGYGPKGFAGAEGETGEMRRNIYAVVEGSIALKNHRDLKQVPLKDDALREEYGEVKKRIAAWEVQDGDEYCRGKNEVMFKIL